MASVLILDDNVTDFTGVSENLIVYGGHEVESRQMSAEMLGEIGEGDLPDVIVMKAEIATKEDEAEINNEVAALTLTNEIKSGDKHPNLKNVPIVILSESAELRRLAVEMCGADRGCELNDDPQELSKVIDSVLRNNEILKI